MHYLMFILLFRFIAFIILLNKFYIYMFFQYIW